MNGGEKRLNAMDRLGDMGHFPAVVNAGATVNVLLTMAATWWVEPRYPTLAGVWVALVIAANLTPVVLLRMAMGRATTFPRVREMNFFSDQHKFSDWVYVAASANMMVWVLVAWTGAAICYAGGHTSGRTGGVLAGLLAVAAVVTFSPVLLRVFRGRNGATLKVSRDA